MRGAARHMKIFAALLAIAALGASASTRIAASSDGLRKLDSHLQRRAHLASGKSRVIIRAAAGASLPDIVPVIKQAGGTPGRRLPIIGSQVAIVSNGALRRLAANPLVD